jgi:hypothetical protein
VTQRFRKPSRGDLFAIDDGNIAGEKGRHDGTGTARHEQSILMPTPCPANEEAC